MTPTYDRDGDEVSAAQVMGPARGCDDCEGELICPDCGRPCHTCEGRGWL